MTGLASMFKTVKPKIICGDGVTKRVSLSSIFKTVKHDHTCHCGGVEKEHEIGHYGCKRFMTNPPDFKEASLFTYTEQRGYHQHPCGCWSRWEGSTNSIKSLATLFKMGTPASGNRGHRGRPGKVGGSSPKDGALHVETLSKGKGDIYLYHTGHNPPSDELKSQWLKQISTWPTTTDREDARRWIAADAIRTTGDTASIAVALKGNELKGVISYRGANTWEDMTATSVYVYDLASKERGYGTSLIMNAIRDADKNKVEVKLYALKDAVPFYLGLGFKREMDRHRNADYDENTLYLDKKQAKKLVKMSTTKAKALSEWEQFLVIMEKLEPEDGAFTMPKKIIRPKQLLPIFEVTKGNARSGNWNHEGIPNHRGGSKPKKGSNALTDYSNKDIEHVEKIFNKEFITQCKKIYKDVDKTYIENCRAVYEDAMGLVMGSPRNGESKVMLGMLEELGSTGKISMTQSQFNVKAEKFYIQEYTNEEGYVAFKAGAIATYNTTQQVLKERGITSVEVYRGLTKGQTLPTNKTSFWSSSEEFASAFADDKGKVVKARIPAKQIIYHSSTNPSVFSFYADGSIPVDDADELLVRMTPKVKAVTVGKGHHASWLSYSPTKKLSAQQSDALLYKFRLDSVAFEDQGKEKAFGLSLLFKIGTAESGNYGHTSVTRDEQDARGGSDPNPQAASKRRGERAGLVVTEAERKKNKEDDARLAEKLGLKRAIRKKDGTMVWENGTKVPKELLTDLASGIPPGLEDIYINPSKKSIDAGNYAVRGRSVTTGDPCRIYTKAAKAAKKDDYWVKVGTLEKHEGSMSRRIERESNGAAYLDLEENSSCLRLIQKSAIRVGSDDDTYGVYGAISLLGKHVTVKGNTAVLDFIGKESVRNVITVTDKWLVKELKQRKADAGNNGKLFETKYNGKLGLLAYTKSLHKNQYTPKMFRSLRATQWAWDEMQKVHKMPTTKKEYTALVKQVCAPVGKKLGHTSKDGEPWSMAYNNYVDPRLFADWKKSAGV